MQKKVSLSYGVNLVLVALVFAAIFALISSGFINNYLGSILVNVCITIIMAVSLNVVTGCLGQLTLGHAGFMSIGAYTAALFSKAEFLPQPFGFFVGMLLGGFLAAFIGFFIGLPALRLKGDYLAIITLGFGEIIRVIIENLEFTGGARGLSSIPKTTTFPVAYWVMAVSIFLMYTMMKSRHGRAILAIREDEIAASASGINVTRYKMLAFTFAAFFAGVGGALYAHYNTVLDAKDFNYARSIEILIIVVLGGLGSFTGSIVSAGVLTSLPEILRTFSQFRMLFYAVALIIMMIFRPKGLFGKYEISPTRTLLKWFSGGKKPPNLPDDESGYLTLNPNSVLGVRDLGITFGGLKAVSEVTLNINRGELVGLIGPNGAGKTTIFNLLTGVYKPTDGEIFLKGKNILHMRPDQLAASGIARTFQNIRLFKELSVLDNVMIACNHELHCSASSSMFRLPAYWEEEKLVREKAMSLLKEFELDEYANYKANNLPYGQQRRLEIARALGTAPSLLLLDEPAAGMNPTETQSLMAMIQKAREKFNISILLIEHDMHLVLGICERLIVLDYGKIICQGNPKEVVNDPAVIAAYLGD